MDRVLLRRFEKKWKKYIKKSQKITPRPSPHRLPAEPFSPSPKKRSATRHTVSSSLASCLTPSSHCLPFNMSRILMHTATPLLRSHPVKRALSVTDLSVPTYVIPWKRTFATHVILAHFSDNLFNATVLWTNSEVRKREGYGENGGPSNRVQ